VRQGPLAGRYVAVAAMVMLALIPYLALSAALGPLTPIIGKDLDMSAQTLSLSSGLANAAYAVGTVLAVQFAQHLPQRRMLVGYALLLLIGSILAASAQDPGMYIAGRVIQGLCTSLLLIAAVPPLAIGYPANKLRDTAVIMNLCIFGAVALGPFIGGLQAEGGGWRPLFWIVAGISLGAFVLSVLTFQDSPPANPDSPTDLPAIALAAVGCVAAFFGASQLTSHRFLDPIVIVPLLGGLAAIVILVVYQYRAKQPLLTIRTMLTSTMPVAGIAVALFAAAASVSATVLTAAALVGHYSPLRIGVLYLPEVAGAVITAVVLGLVITRRAMHYLPLVGMGFLAAGILVFAIHVPSSQAATLLGSGLTGIGPGATVAPALFVAGFSLPSANLQRVFAIVELLRAVAAFMVAPIFVYFAANVGSSSEEGTQIALWIGFGLAVVGALVGVALYALGGARPQAPDLPRFLKGEHPAWYSPPLLARVRRRLATTQVATDSAD
jgi:MFS family permease